MGKRKCHWCTSPRLFALNNNGIKGKGYAEWNWVCNDCGKNQPRILPTIDYTKEENV